MREVLLLCCSQRRGDRSRKEMYSKEREGGVPLDLDSTSEAAPTGPWTGLIPTSGTEKREGSKELLGKILLSLFISFVAPTRVSHKAMEQQSKTSTWTMRPAHTHTLQSDSPCCGKKASEEQWSNREVGMGTLGE